MELIEKSLSFTELNWDSTFFGITAAKATLHSPLSHKEWRELERAFKKYKFISIINENSEPKNAQLVGKFTSAFLADVNIQFQKRISGFCTLHQNISIHQALHRNAEILDIQNFQHSKFIEDPEFKKRGGDQVYRQWLISSFEKQDKYFALSKDDKHRINGFILFSYSNDICVIELIAVTTKEKHSGIGSKLFAVVEYKAGLENCKEIRVGTQLRNIEAINFYQKNGCKQIGCHQIYHLWNL